MRRHCRSVALAVALVCAAALLGPAASATTAPRQWQGPGTDWWMPLLALSKAHEKTTGKGVDVAVIDTGINPDIPELRGADVRLGDSSCSFLPTKTSKDAFSGHGTDMVTVIAGQGRGDSGKGRLGIAPEATVTFYANGTRYGKDAPLEVCNGTFTGELVRTAVDDGADIINLSYSGPYSSKLKAAVEHANEKGVVVVAASGDSREADDAYLYPQTFPGVLNVQAVDRKGYPWRYNPKPDDGDPLGGDFWPWISAPGVGVTAIGVVDGRWRSDAATVDGTSTATAVVSGLLALLKSRYPDATGNQLIQAILHSTPTKTMQYRPDVGFGIASITQMLKQDPTGWPDENPLLLSPAAFMKKYPRDSYRAPTADDSPSAAATEGAPRPDADRAASDGGVPTGAWIAGGVVVLVLAAGGALVLARRRSP